MKKRLLRTLAMIFLIVPCMTVLTACDGVFSINNKSDTTVDYTEYVAELENEIADLQVQLQNYITSTAQLNAEIATLQNQIAMLIAANQDGAALLELLRSKDEEIALLKSQITNLQNQIVNLDSDKDELQSQVISLQGDVVRITNEKNAEIESLTQAKNAQIADLNQQIAGLVQTVSDMTDDALALQSLIDELSTGNSSQASQIEALTTLINGYLSTIAGYENTITQLQNLVAYLESTIPDIALRAEFLVSYEVDGGIWHAQLVRDGNYSDMPPAPSGNWIHEGWSLDGVNSVDPTTVQITKDVKFYALIKCQVTFMANGVQYGATQNVKQGNSPVIPNEPTSNETGYKFAGWTLNGVDTINLTGYSVPHNITLYAKFELLTVSPAVDSWTTIGLVSDAIANGADPASFNYHVGDEKQSFVGIESVTLVILGFNHDDKTDGTGKAGITWGMKNLLSLATYRMNASATNVGGWDGCEMRNTTLLNILATLPSDLQAVIKTVNKKATAGGIAKTIKISADRLFLFSQVEIDNTTINGWAGEGVQYQYWKTVKDGTVAANRAKYLSDGAGANANWWVRSPNVDYNDTFTWVAAGSFVKRAANSALGGLSFGFAV